MRTRALLLVAALACALLASGCSALFTKTVEVPVTGPDGAVAGASSAVPCPQLVTVNPGKAPTVHNGTCVQNGTTVQIVHPHQLIKLDTLTAEVLDVRLAPSLHTGRHTLYADGRYVLLTLRIGNHWNLPARFDGGERQTSLQGHQIRFSEATGTEGYLANSCLSRSVHPIRRGGSRTCLVVFNVPISVLTRMRQRGAALLVTDFDVDSSTDNPIAEGIVYLRLPRRDDPIDFG